MNVNCDPIELGRPKGIRLRRLLQGGLAPRVTGRLFRVTSEHRHRAGLITNCRKFHGAARALDWSCRAFVPRPRSFIY